MLATLSSFITFAQEGGHEAEPEGIDLVLPDPAELIWGAVAFFFVALFLMKVAFPKIRDAVKAREEKIQGDVEDAEKSKAEAQKELEKYKSQLAEARAEANRIIEEARQQAEQVRKDLVDKAQVEAEQVVSRAQEQIEAERNRTVQELKGTIADLSIELAEKVVGRALDDKSQRELVDAYINEVAGMNGGSNN
ncbi:MAG TPA: F0F1 ATP synthase subunit B [Actinomycetota bacterium]|nr:F0F1 ATP synthase subunit B [Actinomycetota bacterium]